MTTSTTTISESSRDNAVISEYGKENIFPIETPIEIDPDYTNYSEEAEKANGRWAMIGFVALLGSYLSTGQIIPGIF
tara:strand:- start:327 stop:557 length:231 start_codon:yes stop_codon:yes gene_type:complete